MSNIFTYDTQDLDLKESIKLRTNCQQLDTIVLNFNIFNYDVQVDLTNFNIEFRGIKPDGTIYSQTDNITKTGNLLTINCSNNLTSVIGTTTCEIRIWNSTGSQKSSYFIVLNISGIVSDTDRIVSKTIIDSLEHLDNSINSAIETSKILDISIANGDIDSINLQLSEKANKSDLDETNSNISSEISTRQTNDNNLQSQINTIVLQGTSGDSSAEVAQNRVDSIGSTFTTMKEHSDNIEKIIKTGISNIKFSDWEIGGLVSSSGVPIVATDKIRSNTFHIIGVNKITVKPETNYLVMLFWYNASKAFVGKSDNWISTETEIEIEYPYYKFVILVTGGTAEISWSNHVAITCKYENEELSNARGAYKTLPMRIDAIASLIKDGKTLLTFDDWENGSIFTDGTNTTSTTVIRSKTYKDVSEFNSLIFSPTSDYWVGYASYDKNYNFVELVTWITSETQKALTGKYYRFLVYHATGTQSSTWANEVGIYGSSEFATTKIETHFASNYYAVEGVEWNMYMDQVVKNAENYKFYPMVSGLSYEKVKYYDGNLRVKPVIGDAGTYDFTIRIVKDDGSIESVATFNLIIVAKPLTTLKGMYLGDSLTSSGERQWALLDNLSSVSLIGTRITTINSKIIYHEGRAGWSTADYFTASNGGFTNPFFNPSTSTFDFNYYMTQQGFSGLNFVVIQIGRNDGIDTTAYLDNIETMITSIHVYNPNIKVFVCTHALTPKNQPVGTSVLWNTHYWRTLTYVANDNIYTKFGNRETSNIYVIPNNINIDTVYDYPHELQAVSARNTENVERWTNEVHPNSFGFYKMGDIETAYISAKFS